MLRYILTHKEWATISDEFLLLERYCELQKLRFQERLESVIYYDNEVARCKIPKLLLQPLVENAIIHGIEPSDNGGILHASATFIDKNDQHFLQILIKDNGVGFNPESVDDQTHVGLLNVRERLTLTYPYASFSITSKVGQGTIIIIEIPKKDTVEE
jgi:two-component system sensor histidine kinase YesM